MAAPHSEIITISNYRVGFGRSGREWVFGTSICDMICMASTARYYELRCIFTGDGSCMYFKMYHTSAYLLECWLSMRLGRTRTSYACGITTMSVEAIQKHSIYVASLLCDKLCHASGHLAACTLQFLFYAHSPTPFTLALAMIRSRFCLRIFILVVARTNSSEPLRPSSPAEDAVKVGRAPSRCSWSTATAMFPQDGTLGREHHRCS